MFMSALDAESFLLHRAAVASANWRGEAWGGKAIAIEIGTYWIFNRTPKYIRISARACTDI